MKSRWQNYKELELIPDTVGDPNRHRIALWDWLSRRQQSRLTKLIENSSFEEKVGYLERSLTLDCEATAGSSSFWERLWQMLNQPIPGIWQRSPQEPQISQIADREGHLWWQAYDPLTGQTTYLDSEEEVQIWLEERLYH